MVGRQKKQTNKNQTTTKTWWEELIHAQGDFICKEPGPIINETLDFSRDSGISALLNSLRKGLTDRTFIPSF